MQSDCVWDITLDGVGLCLCSAAVLLAYLTTAPLFPAAAYAFGLAVITHCSLATWHIYVTRYDLALRCLAGMPVSRLAVDTAIDMLRPGLVAVAAATLMVALLWTNITPIETFADVVQRIMPYTCTLAACIVAAAAMVGSAVSIAALRTPRRCALMSSPTVSATLPGWFAGPRIANAVAGIYLMESTLPIAGADWTSIALAVGACFLLAVRASTAAGRTHHARAIRAAGPVPSSRIPVSLAMPGRDPIHVGAIWIALATLIAHYCDAMVRQHASSEGSPERWQEGEPDSEIATATAHGDAIPSLSIASKVAYPPSTNAQLDYADTRVAGSEPFGHVRQEDTQPLGARPDLPTERRHAPAESDSIAHGTAPFLHTLQKVELAANVKPQPAAANGSPDPTVQQAYPTPPWHPPSGGTLDMAGIPIIKFPPNGNKVLNIRIGDGWRAEDVFEGTFPFPIHKESGTFSSIGDSQGGVTMPGKSWEDYAAANTAPRLALFGTASHIVVEFTDDPSPYYEDNGALWPDSWASSVAGMGVIIFSLEVT